MSNLFYFDLLTAITILLAFLADLILAPALMSLLAHRGASQEEGGHPRLGMAASFHSLISEAGVGPAT